MNRKPKQYFAADLEKAVRDYHEWHGDTNVQLIGYVCDCLGDAWILTRVKDEQKKKKSCLLDFYIMAGGEWDISEMESCDRADEFYMVQERMGGNVNEEDT